MASGAVTVERVDADAGKAAAIRVRWAVFVDEQRVPPGEEVDAHDADPATVHFVARDATGAPVGAARLRVYAEGVGKIERVAVLPSHRGRRVGRALVRAAEDAARARGDGEVVLDAQRRAEGFYAKLGYRAMGGTFMDAGIPHVRMVKALR